MNRNANRERNVNYVIRESRYLVGNEYHSTAFKFDCSIENAKYYTVNANKMSKEERLAASTWAARCMFDRMLKRADFASRLRARNEEDVLKFLKHEHVIRLFATCASTLRDWDETWVSTIFLIGTMLVNVPPDASLKAVRMIARNPHSRARIVQHLNDTSRDALYRHLMTRLRNAIANRKPLSSAFPGLEGLVLPVVANAHRNLQLSQKRVMKKAANRLDRSR